ncbi:hypothetical protein BGC07_15795 [Piscirickettsia litoralis]|uniref:Uncharacterized protein n=2 Tax=Piscirickettsia litoralis TaxID=1891921 RepID=A0ABX2ZY74_9GAMM|nr:hypothetical protein BGC07_15795 [Piscirickettsia litoralis]
MIDTRIDYAPVGDDIKSEILSIKKQAEELNKKYESVVDKILDRLPADSRIAVSMDVDLQRFHAEVRLAESVMWMVKSLTHPCDDTHGI